MKSRIAKHSHKMSPRRSLGLEALFASVKPKRKYTKSGHKRCPKGSRKYKDVCTPVADLPKSKKRCPKGSRKYNGVCTPVADLPARRTRCSKGSRKYKDNCTPVAEIIRRFKCQKGFVQKPAGSKNCVPSTRKSRSGKKSAQ